MKPCATLAQKLLSRGQAEKSYTQWIAALETSGQEIDRRAAAAKDPIKGQKLLRHISGIERWGQSRLRVFLGAPFVRDEYDGYQPGTTFSLDEQRAFFRATRQETIALGADAGGGEDP